MRVLHVINQISVRAGAEISLREIAVGTTGPDLQHAIAVLDFREHALDSLDGIRVYAPKRPLDTIAARTQHVRDCVMGFKPDLLHTSLFDADVAGRIAGKWTNTPVLTSLVNTPYEPAATGDGNVGGLKLRVVKEFDRTLSRFATRHFHAITQTVADSAVRQLSIDRTKITVVPRGRSRQRLGYPSQARRSAVRERLGLDANATVFLNVARQEPQKGHTYLIDAFAHVLRSNPEAILLLAGRDGRRTSEINSRIRANGVGPAVRLLGQRDDVADLLCASDAFVFPSLYEGLGGAVLEAMALDVPIVSSDAPALREVLADGACGLIVPRRDTDALAKAMLGVTSDDAAARSRVLSARRRFDDVYELQQCLSGMRSLYDALR